MKTETIGAFIRRCRAVAGLTQKELAEAIQMTDRSITDWERDVSVPGRDAMVRLSSVFQVSLDEFRKRLDRNSDLDKELTEAIQEEIEQKRQRAVDVIDDLIAADPRKIDDFIRYGEWLTHQSGVSPGDR